MPLYSRNENFLSVLCFYACGVVLTQGVYSGLGLPRLLIFENFILIFNNIQWKVEYLREINLYQITRGVLSNLSC